MAFFFALVIGIIVFENKDISKETKIEDKKTQVEANKIIKKEKTISERNPDNCYLPQ
jgi:hypothetical protein